MKKLEIYEGQAYAPCVAALEVTLRCNMRCLHCGSSADGKPRSRELSLADWQRVVDELAALGTEYFTLSGGEPFVWPQWRELSKDVRDHDKTLSIISNGSLISGDDVAYLTSIGLWNIALSIDGMRESHDHIRRTAGSFDQAIRTIALFKKTPVKVCVSTSVNKINFDDLATLRARLDRSGVELWQVQVVNSFGRAGVLRDMLLITPEQYVELVHFIHESQQMQKAGKLRMKVMPADSVGYCHGIGAEIWGDLEWTGCNAGRYVIGIQSNGDVLGCLSLQGEKFVAGNVLERSLSEIWADDAAFGYNRNFSADKLRGPCRDCSAGEACRSGCLGMGYSTSGELYHNAYCYKHLMEGKAYEAIAV